MRLQGGPGEVHSEASPAGVSVEFSVLVPEVAWARNRKPWSEIWSVCLFL